MEKDSIISTPSLKFISTKRVLIYYDGKVAGLLQLLVDDKCFLDYYSLY